jgi:hypothetical protein
LALIDKINLAPTGSTGNNTHDAVATGDYDAVVFQFVVESVGATPTVTYKFQGSVDGTNWYDIGYITDATDGISQATRTRTAVGADVAFLSNPRARKYQHFRVVTSANTNVTYRAEMRLV